LATGIKIYKFVFIGCRWWFFTFVREANVPEGKGYGGFPVSGQWLKCTNPDVIKHKVKVYGKASVGAPNVSSTYDSRMINGENSCYLDLLLVFYSLSKNGSYSDLPLSIKPDNIIPMIAAGIKISAY
jgi:malate dehydrogenase (quinone)